jgi:putative sterol carrier protein
MTQVVFPFEEWLDQLKEQLNTSPAYADAAKNWEGDFYFVIDPEKNSPLSDSVYLYMDLWHGACRDAYRVMDKAEKTPAYVMSGPYGKWKKVVTAKLDPIQALVTGQLKLKGNMVMVMKNVKAAQEIIRACTRIDAAFPDEMA